MNPPAHPISITFLGTSSGGGPTDARNCSSLVAQAMPDGSLWMFDCAEGTIRQFALQTTTGYQRLRPNKVNKMFITHMHADHTMGIITMLRQVLGFAEPDQEPIPYAPKLDLYGPAGLRNFVRSILKMTLTKTGHRYAVHELLTPQDFITPCTTNLLHSSEAPGRDIFATDDGLWREIVEGDLVSVDAGPIEHRDPCIGYVIREAPPHSRKIVILGDTFDPTAISPLCADPSPSLLIHESTDAYIPASVDPTAKRTAEIVHSKAVQRGHSTPQMAGAFAKQIGAQKLLLNHIGSRFMSPKNCGRAQREQRTAILGEIERQASESWGMGHARVASDFMQVTVVPRSMESSAVVPSGQDLDVLLLEDDADETPVTPTQFSTSRGRGQRNFHSRGGQDSDDARGSRGRGRRHHPGDNQGRHPGQGTEPNTGGVHRSTGYRGQRRKEY